MTQSEREQSIRALLPLVRQIARRVQHVTRAADLDDLVGDGSVGLIRAVDAFDASRGSTLDTYARKLIMGAMLNGMRRLDPVSERARRKMRRAEERRFALAQARGTLPSIAELERSDPALVRARVAAYRHAPLSLDAPLPPEVAAPADWSAEPAGKVAQRAGRRELLEAVALLPERQQRILELHYGREMPLRAISERMRVSPQRVSQLHLEALARLRGRMPAPP